MALVAVGLAAALGIDGDGDDLLGVGAVSPRAPRTACTALTEYMLV